MKEKAANQQELGLYIHIPFCVKKCSYCDFLSAAASDELKTEYIEALLKEIYSYQGRTSEYSIGTIFFGGGTPSCIAAEDIARIMQAIRQVFHVNEKQLEATIEVNPGTIKEDKLVTYRNAGMNRLSFGLQSADNKELNCLGRIHTYEGFWENYQLARQLGFTNISVDLMSALPGQTLASWENTLNIVVKLKPEHISAYSLIIEEGTEFYDRYRPGTKGALELPDEDTDRRIYYRTKELLEQYGYHRYEISNYAMPGYESRHNNSYWIGTDYLGLGLGAASLLKGVRFSNKSDLKEYIALCNTDMNQECTKECGDTAMTCKYPILRDNTEEVNRDIPRVNTEEVNRDIPRVDTEGVNRDIQRGDTEEVNRDISRVNTEEVNRDIPRVNTEEVNRDIQRVNTEEVNRDIQRGDTDDVILTQRNATEGVSLNSQKDNTEDAVQNILKDEIGIRTDCVLLTKEQRMEEFLFLGLRRCEGISRQEFNKRFSQDIKSVYGIIIEELEQKKLIESSGDIIRLTDYGIDISNVVLAQFLFD